MCSGSIRVRFESAEYSTVKPASCLRAVAITVALALPQPAIAEARAIRYDPPLEVTSGVRQDVKYSTYVDSIAINDQEGIRLAIFETRTRVMFGPHAGKTDSIRGRWFADCDNSTLNGQVVTARPRSSAERGSAKVLNVICEAR